MSLSEPIHYFSDDFLLDTSLSFEARSLYMLVSSLSGDDSAMYAPSTTILVAATGWSREVVEGFGAELVAARIIQEIPGEETRYALLHHKAIPTAGPVKKKASLPSLSKDVLSQEEISALLHVFH